MVWFNMLIHNVWYNLYYFCYINVLFASVNLHWFIIIHINNEQIYKRFNLHMRMTNNRRPAMRKLSTETVVQNHRKYSCVSLHLLKCHFAELALRKTTASIRAESHWQTTETQPLDIHIFLDQIKHSVGWLVQKIKWVHRFFTKLLTPECSWSALSEHAAIAILSWPFTSEI